LWDRHAGISSIKRLERCWAGTTAIQGQGGFLTTTMSRTHEKFFTEPWHVAILLPPEAVASPDDSSRDARQRRLA